MRMNRFAGLDFTYTKTPEKVRLFIIELLGAKKAKRLFKTMKNREWIVITGPSGPTGKSTLAGILISIGYTRVLELGEATTIEMNEPLTDLQEKRSIFEQLGISWIY